VLAGRIVLFGVGSPVVADVEESIGRLGLEIAAAVRNVPGEVYVVDRRAVIDVQAVEAGLFATPFLVPLFTPAFRQRALTEARQLGFTTPATIIDPTTIRPITLECGEGTFINAGCTIGAASALGPFTFVNRAASIGHHAVTERFVSIGPGAVMAGQVTIGFGSVIGAGAVLLPGVRVGANAVVGAGAVVTRDVPDHHLVVGNPARPVRTDIPGYGDHGVT
jgi:hypothetical protein